MRSRTSTQIRDLRRAIDALPIRTREAMLIGIDNNTIVVGAYATNDGVCPMLAAHRAGGRTSYIHFAKAWDEYCFRGIRLGRRRARPATRTELATLRSHIETSLMADDEPVSLTGALAEHHHLVERNRELDERTAARKRRISARIEAEVRRETAAAAEAPTLVAGAEVPAPAVAEPRRSRTAPRPGDPDRSGELRNRPAWRWMKVVRSYEDYRDTLAQLDADEANQSATDRERELVQHRH